MCTSFSIFKNQGIQKKKGKKGAAVWRRNKITQKKKKKKKGKGLE
jgi:hypothetical protein